MNKYQWYAVHTMAQAEQKVQKLIENTKTKHGMDNFVKDVIIPTEIELKAKRLKNTRKFFQDMF
jgi:transcription antitermination factor NusG